MLHLVLGPICPGGEKGCWDRTFRGPAISAHELQSVRDSCFSLLLQIEVKLSVKFTSREFSLKRMPSRKQTGVFGVKIAVVTK